MMFDRQGHCLTTNESKSSLLGFKECETAVDGMVVIDRDLNVLRVNKTFLSMLGWASGEVIGKKCYEVFSSSSLCHTADCPLTRILSGEAHVEVETEKTRK